jgi:hypothetical protein
LSVANDLEFESEDFPDDISETMTNDEMALSDEDEENNTSINVTGIDLNNEGLIDEHLMRINRLLRKARILVYMIKNSSNILRYIRAKRREANLTVEIIKDFKIRWNYTNLFVIRLLKYQKIINEVTSNPNLIPGLTSRQMSKLKTLNITESDWSSLLALTDTLNPFYMATKILSGKTYHTLSKSWILLNGIRGFLAVVELQSSEEESFEHEYQNLKNENYYSTLNRLKELLSESLEFYLHKHVSAYQREATLVILLRFLE